MSRISAALSLLALAGLVLVVFQVSSSLAAQIPKGTYRTATTVYQQDWPANMSIPDLRSISQW